MTAFRSTVLPLAAALLLAGTAAPVLGAPSSAITAALADAKRPATDSARDTDRHAAELLDFAGVKSGQIVLEILPGGGYFTRLLSDVVGPKGHVVAYIPAEMAKPDSVDKLATAMRTEGRANVEVLSDPLMNPPPGKALGTADLIWTSQNYHDLHNIAGVDVSAYDKLLFSVLKPGGIFIVTDHAAPAGSELTTTNTTHRIDPAVVRRELESAGFTFVSMSPVLANSADPKTAKVFDPAIRGHTDQFVFKFMRPKK